MAQSAEYSEGHMKNFRVALFALPLLLAACAPATSGNVSTTSVNAPDAPVKPGDTWEVSGTAASGDKFTGTVRLNKVSPSRSERGTYSYDADDGFVSWRENGFMWVYTSDTAGGRINTCITYNARPGIAGPYSAYAVVGTGAEVQSLFTKLGNSDNPYGVLGSANACTITKK